MYSRYECPSMHIQKQEWCLAVLMLTSRQELRSVCASISTFQDTGKLSQCLTHQFSLVAQYLNVRQR
jgi:hypothetical protein